jgi:hypothetical protein
MNIFYIIGVVVVIIVVAGFLGLRVLGRAASLARGRSLQDAARAQGIELSDFGDCELL